MRKSLFAKYLVHIALKRSKFHGVRANGIFGHKMASIVVSFRWAVGNELRTDTARAHGNRHVPHLDISLLVAGTGVLGLVNPTRSYYETGTL